MNNESEKPTIMVVGDTPADLDQHARMLENILQHAADGICVCHNIPEAPHVRFTHWNPQMDAITGYTMDEINQLGWYQTMYPDPEVQKRAIERMARMRTGDDIQAEEWTITRKDGAKRCLSISTSIITEEDRRVHVLALMHDITERKRIEEELRSNQSLLEGVLNGLKDVVGIQLPDHTMIRYNKAGYELLGLSPDEVTGRKCYELIGRAEPRENCATRAAVQTKRIETVENFFPELDRHFLCTSNPILGPDGEIRLIVEQLTDITDRVKAEQALRESEQKYRFISENMLDIVWIVGPDLSTTYVSPSIEKVLGFTPEERKQQAPEEIMTPESYRKIMGRLAEEIRQDQEGGADPDRSVIIDVEYHCKDGSTVWMENQVQAIRDAENRLLGMFGVSRDITERKHNQSVLQAERDMGAAWSAARSLEVRLEICLRTAIQVSSLDGGGIYVLDETDGSLALRVHQGLSEDFVHDVSHFSGDSSNAQLVRQGVPTYIKAKDLPGARRDVLLSEGIKGLAIVPLIFEGRAVGCLNVASRSMDHIPEHARATLEQIARYASSFVAQDMQEDQIRQSHRDLDTLFNTVQDMLFILDGEGKIVHHNTVVTENLGYAADDLIGKPVLFVLPEDRHEEALKVIASMLAGEADTSPIPLKTRDGRLIPVETKVVRGHWKGRKVIIGICRDISERLELERRVRQVEKAESLNRMAGAIAHHFNNQLQAVMGHLELAMFDMPQAGGPLEALAEAMKAAHRAARVSGQMLTYLGLTPAADLPN